MSCFGVIKDEPKEGIMAEVLSSFLSSSLNIELVYIILAGIVRFSKPQRSFYKPAKSNDLEKREDEDDESESNEVDEFEQIRAMQLNKIKIYNATQWDIAKYDQYIYSATNELNQRLASSVATAEHRKTGKQMEEQIINQEVKISDFAYKKFQELRELDGIDYDQILKSLSPAVNNKAVFKAGESTGKSGSFFFFSHDRKFIIKTMFQEELYIMMENLPTYFEYIFANPKSLIARIYGVFQVQMEGIVPVNLLIMANTIQNWSQDNCISKVYDLKGSYIHRMVSINEKQTLKDRNLLSVKQKRRNHKIHGLLQFDIKNDIKHIRSTLAKDNAFLQGLGFLDYSLLLAVEKVKHPDPFSKIEIPTDIEVETIEDQQRASKNRHRFASSCGNYVYHIAIIDYITQFSISKRVESYYKVHIKNQKAELVSCVHPDLYGRRFIDFMTKEVIVNEELSEEKNLNLDDELKQELFSQLLADFNRGYETYSSAKSSFTFGVN